MKKIYIMTIMLLSVIFSKAGNYPEETQVSLFYAPGCIYEQVSDNLSDYFMLMSDVPSTYNMTTGEIAMDEAGWSVCIDFYGQRSTETIEIPVGSYTAGDGTAEFTYDTRYSYVNYIDALGNSNGCQIDEVTVRRNTQGATIINITASANGVQYTFTYVGTPSFTNASGGSTSHALSQIQHDVNATFTHCQPTYYGNLYDSDTGNFILDLYDGDYDENYGTMKGPGYHVSLNIFNTLFSKPEDAYVKDGTYTMARNFQRGTYYPGTEVNYMGYTTMIGCFIQQRDQDSVYTSGCLTSGTIKIESLSNVYTITVDMMTDTGYKIQGTFSGSLESIRDQSDDEKSAAVVSTLTEDYDMTLTQIPVARLYKEENCANCCRYVLDIGSVSGKDQCLVDNGGDYFRMDFLTALDQTGVPTGTWNAITEYYQGYFTNYEPGRFVWGHFENGGDIVGTRWGHFMPNRYLVMDGLAPIQKGSFTITDNGNGTYSVDIVCEDDDKHQVTGKWTGPVEKQFDEDGIDLIKSEESGIKNAVYGFDGRRMSTTPSHGLYIMNGKKFMK